LRQSGQVKITAAGQDSAPAIVEAGEVTTFAELRGRSAILTKDWPQRPLVFMEAVNSRACVELYFACLANGFPVFLMPAMPAALLDPLVGRYDPNVLVTFPGGQRMIEIRHNKKLDLHARLSVILSTSGSTGSPKLVKLSARNIESNASSICDYLGITAADRAITSLPFSYSYGMSVVNSHWHAGGSVLINQASPIEPRFWSNFVAGGACSFAGVPYTFEMLARQQSWAASPGLRYVTQAGGRLSPDLVRRMAELGQRHGWDFIVMYGQTEASPRMAYLPPRLALDHPDCVGRAIPGGSLSLVDEHGRTIDGVNTPGELRYSGPNVMMGYASAVEDLARDETPDYLATGDLAVRTDEELFRIIGRASRLAKPFGIRVDLDDLERRTGEFLPAPLCVADDSLIVVASTQPPPPDLRQRLASELHLPTSAIQLILLDSVPLLPSGKTDYQGLLERGRAASAKELGHDPGERPSSSLRHYMQLAWSMGLQILGLRRAGWQSVEEIFTTFLPGSQAIGPQASFSTLASDSLAYVQVSIALEDYLGRLPEGWEDMAVASLEELRPEPSVF